MGKITTRLGMDITLHCSRGRIIVEGDGRRVVVHKLNTSEAYFQYPGKVFVKEDNTPEGTMAAIQHLVNQLLPNKISTKPNPTVGVLVCCCPFDGGFNPHICRPLIPQ